MGLQTPKIMGFSWEIMDTVNQTDGEEKQTPIQPARLQKALVTPEKLHGTVQKLLSPKHKREI